MKNTLLLILLALLSINTLVAQTGTIRGNLFDKETGEPIIYGTVQLDGTTIGTNTFT